ncbi:Uncharacterised protein [uncultured archaeon]|nr:Uncharacterised protein [uncultured archaeon]
MVETIAVSNKVKVNGVLPTNGNATNGTAVISNFLPGNGTTDKAILKFSSDPYLGLSGKELRNTIAQNLERLIIRGNLRGFTAMFEFGGKEVSHLHNNLLAYAIHHDQREIAQYLVKQGARITNYELQDVFYLHFAANLRKPFYQKLLGATPDSPLKAAEHKFEPPRPVIMQMLPDRRTPEESVSIVLLNALYPGEAAAALRDLQNTLEMSDSDFKALVSRVEASQPKKVA